MAGSLKHKERSHKTYNSNVSVFEGFKNHAYIKTNQKKNRKALGETLKKIFNRNQSK